MQYLSVVQRLIREDDDVPEIVTDVDNFNTKIRSVLA